MRVVGFFNHKGGVGKTTLVFNTGLALAQSGHRVLFIDADAQTNLTAVSLAPDAVEVAYENRQAISDVLAPLVDGSGDLAIADPVRLRRNAFLVPGHIRLSEFEDLCPQAWTEALSGAQRGIRVTSGLFRLAQEYGKAIDADIVLFDVGPNVGALNRNILLSCDGFVVPLAPDLFSLNALSSVGRAGSHWIEDWHVIEGAVDRKQLELGFDLPRGRPSPLGYISQQFAIYRQAPAAAYRRWLKQIPDAYQAEIVARFQDAGVQVPVGDNKIGEVRNLSSLVPIAQRANLAIFELGGSEARGAQFTRAQDTLGMFSAIGQQVVERVDSVMSVE